MKILKYKNVKYQNFSLKTFTTCIILCKIAETYRLKSGNKYCEFVILTYKIRYKIIEKFNVFSFLVLIYDIYE